MKKILLATLLACAAGAAFPRPPHTPPPFAAAQCPTCGTVQDVRAEKRKGEGGAVGVVGGAVVGGLLGNQIGGGTGKALATVGGAVAGGYVGNEVQKRVTRKTVWVTTVRLNDGSVRTFEQESRPAWKAGSRVRAEGAHLQRL